MTRDQICNGLQEISDEAYSRWVNHQYTRDKLIIGIGTYVGEAIKLLKEQPEIVRCKDCKHSCDYTDIYPYRIAYKCIKNGGYHNDDWFCADGEVGTYETD